MASLSAGSHSFFLKSPAELGKARCFAVKRGETADRLDAKFHALHEILSSPFPLVEFGRLVCAEPDYGLSSRAVPRTSNKQPRYIRITDFGEDGIEPDHKFVTPTPLYRVTNSIAMTLFFLALVALERPTCTKMLANLLFSLDIVSDLNFIFQKCCRNSFIGGRRPKRMKGGLQPFTGLRYSRTSTRQNSNPVRFHYLKLKFRANS